METQKTTKNRLLYMDNIRWVMIILVVIMHLNVTYSNMGLWYYKEAVKVDGLSALIFGLYGLFTQAYFMGLLFFIAGYFVPGSYDKRGTSAFIKERLIRLGIPSLVYMVLIHPLNVLITQAYTPNNIQGFLSWYFGYIFSFNFISASGPLWFAVALLIFSLAYALFKEILFKEVKAEKSLKGTSIKHIHVLAIIGIIAIIAFIIRLITPAGIPLFNNNLGNFMQIGYFSSYIVLFVLGTIVSRRKLLESLTYRFGRFWFRLALIIGIPLVLLLFVLGGAAKNPLILFGGFSWQSMAFALWESFFCVGICMGFIVIFREKFNSQGRVSKFLSENAFGVYVFHAPILLAITLSFKGFVLIPCLKMFLMIAIVLPVCFVCSHLLRKIPLIKKVIY